MAVRSGGSTRSGRFSIENKLTAEHNQVVINTSAKAVYRFLNTGSTAYEVMSMTTLKKDKVEPKCSVDVNFTGEFAIVVPAETSVEGIYDYAETHSKIRHGRFVGELAQGKQQTVIRARSGILYRFFNSGDNPLLLKNGTSAPVEIPIKQSLDIVVDNIVRVGTTSANPLKIEAIYEYLDVDNTVRSGRFKRLLADKPRTFHQIIDFRGYSSASKSALYRIFNSGKNNIEIVARLGRNGEKPITTLGSEQSFDIGFDFDGFDKNKTIWIRSTDDTKPIEGIYEFLGFDDD